MLSSIVLILLGAVLGVNVAVFMISSSSGYCAGEGNNVRVGARARVDSSSRRLVAKSAGGVFEPANAPAVTPRLAAETAAAAEATGCAYGDDVVTFKGERNEPLYHQYCRGLVVPTEESKKKYADLEAVLEKVAINREVLVAVSDINPLRGGMLKLWLDGVLRAGIKNYLVVAIDHELEEWCLENGINVHYREAIPSEKQANLGGNHRVSGLKFQILKDFLLLGYHVFLSDVDILTLHDPFQYLYRDVDVESLSDGFNDHTSFGFDDVFDDPGMGWARFAHTFRIFVYNSGLFYIRATYTSVELVDRVVAWLEAEQAWDQAVFNLVIWKPSHGNYVGLNPTTRVLPYFIFQNSKTFFTIVRHNKGLLDKAANEMSMIHVNYHPDKAERLRAMWNYFVEGKKDAISLAKFPNGSETPERLAQIRAEEERKRNGGKRRLLVHQDVTPDEAEN